jgi:hypothetical protein
MESSGVEAVRRLSKRSSIMKHAAVPRFALAVLILAAVGADSRAEMTHWVYETSGTYPLVGNDFTGLGNIRLSSPPGRHDEFGAATIRVLDFHTVNLDNQKGDGYPDTFWRRRYTANLSIQDGDSKLSGTLYFHGAFYGKANEQTHVSGIYTLFEGLSTQSITIGSNRYAATIGPFHPFVWAPVPPIQGQDSGEHFVGALDAHVDVVAVGPTIVTPEPSSLALAGIGLAGAAGAAWRKWRRATIQTHGLSAERVGFD